MMHLSLVIIFGFTSPYGGMGNYEIFTARPLDFGNFSFDMIGDYFYESYIDTAYDDTFHDRRHFGSGSLVLAFSPLPFTELFAGISGFLHYDEKTEPIKIPIQIRKDAYIYGAKEFSGGLKLGIPVFKARDIPLMVSIGGRFGLGTSFPPPASYDTLLNRGFPPPENHGPDYDIRAIGSVKFGALGLHFNGGQIIRGVDRNTHLDRPDGGIYGSGFDLSIRNRFWLFGEIYGNGDNSYFTTGLKLGFVPNFTFNLYFKQGLTDSKIWKVAAGFTIFSTITPRLRKVEAVIAGRIYDAQTGAPVVGIVSFPGSDVQSVMTNPDGTYRVKVSPGTYMILFQASGYRAKERPISVKKGSEILFDVALTKSRDGTEPTGRITGRIFSEREEPIDGEVEILGADIPEVRTEGGQFSIEVEPGRYEITVHAPGYRSAGKVIYIREEGEEVRADFRLTEEEEFPPLFGKISGFIRDGETEAPVPASIRVGNQETTADEDGYYEIQVVAGKPMVEVWASGYRTRKRLVEVEKGSDIVLDFFLTRKRPMGTIIGSVYKSETMEPLSARVIIEGAETKVVNTDPKTGIFRIETDPGIYDVSVQWQDVSTPKAEVTLEQGEIEVLSFYITRPEKTKIPVSEPTFHPIYFDYGSSQYRYEYLDYLDRIADYLLKNQDKKIEIRGHTDSVGPEFHNLILSQQRAESVRDYLISQGVNPSQIYARGYGEGYPVGDNRTLSGRELNRRVDFRILP